MEKRYVNLNKRSISSLDEARELLVDLGYTVKSDSKGIRANAAYRGGDNLSSLLIDKNLNYRDFVTGACGPIEDLIKYHNGEEISIERPSFIEKEEMSKKFDSSLLNDLVPNYSFFKKRGISEETLKLFGGGWCHSGSLNRRYVFPIYDLSDNIIGFSGRTTRLDHKEKGIVKWKHIGKSSKFIYPCHVIDLDNEQNIVIVESIGDVLALHEMGVKNSLCLFGLNISSTIINFICSQNINSIIISTNNDENGRGQEAATKIKSKLDKFFDIVDIKLPKLKDWGDVLLNNKSFDAKEYFSL